MEQFQRQMGKKFGEGILKKLNDMPQSFDVIPTGSMMLDYKLGIGGWPRRCTSMVWGAEDSGKTTLMYNSMAEALKIDGSVLFVDKEGKASQGWIRTNIENMGAPTDKLLIAQQPHGDDAVPFTGTEALDMVKIALKNRVFDLIVIDSAFALSTPAEEDANSADAHMGQLARLLSQYMKHISGLVGASDTALVFTNQLRNKLGVMYGCLPYQTKVKLSNGECLPIGQIVNQQLDIEVLSWNQDTGELEGRRVVNWYKQGIPVDQFSMSDNEIGEVKQEYRTIIAHYPNKAGFVRVATTPNHLIATPHGFRPCGEIDLGDEILSTHFPIVLSKDLEQLLIGSMLGDGSIRKSGVCTAHYREEHASRQEEYVSWKADCFGDLVSRRTQYAGNVGFETRHLTIFKRWKDVFYRVNGRYKDITRGGLDKLSPFSLAVWYQDDGTLLKEDGRKSRYCIYAHKMTKEQTDKIEQLLLSRFGLSARIYRRNTHTDIYFTQENADHFERIVRPYIHPSMKYKIDADKNVGYALDNLDFSFSKKQVVIPCEVYEVRRKIKTGKSAVRYNIEVEGNKTYITQSNIIVHNSPEVAPGGQALLQYSIIIVRLRLGQKFPNNKNPEGVFINARVEKNQARSDGLSPFQPVQWRIRFDCGLDKITDMAEVAIEKGIIYKESGNALFFNGEKLGGGREATLTAIRENPDLADRIKEAVVE